MTSPFLKPLDKYKRHREKCKLLGLCRTCGNKVTRGVYCDECITKRRKKRKERTEKMKALSLCIHCGYPVEKGRVCHNRNECRPSRRVRQ